jgi:hypothetical protein
MIWTDKKSLTLRQEKSMKINSETYAKTLKRLKEQISRIH